MHQLSACFQSPSCGPKLAVAPALILGADLAEAWTKIKSGNPVGPGICRTCEYWQENDACEWGLMRVKQHETSWEPLIDLTIFNTARHINRFTTAWAHQTTSNSRGERSFPLAWHMALGFWEPCGLRALAGGDARGCWECHGDRTDPQRDQHTHTHVWFGDTTNSQAKSVRIYSRLVCTPQILQMDQKAIAIPNCAPGLKHRST